MSGKLGDTIVIESERAHANARRGVIEDVLQEQPPRYHYRTPAMAAGLADHVWTVSELLCHPLYPPKDTPQNSNPRTYADVLKRLHGALIQQADDEP